MSRDERYSLPARVMHWLAALAIPVQVWLGWSSELSASQVESMRMIRLHYQFGVVIAALMMLRLFWRLLHGVPDASAAEAPWRRRFATVAHGWMYGLLFALPISGYVIWVWMDAPMDVFGMFNMPRLFTPPADDESGRALAWYVHYWAGWALVVLILLHVFAAMWHQWIRRDGLIRDRML